MVTILHFFTNYAILIYILLVIGLLFAIRSLVRARHEMSESVYGLEREASSRHTSQAVAVLTLIGFMAVAEFSISVFLVPNLPAISFIGTPTMNPLLSPTGTISPELLSSIGIFPGTTPTNQSTGCTPGQIMITSPKPGDVVKGLVTLVGTADIPNFGFYKYEFSARGTDIWYTILADPKVKQDTDLGIWDTSEISPGDYNLRLVVLDNQNNAPPPCVVPVRVQAP